MPSIARNMQLQQRYNRHIILPEIGEEGQMKLGKAKVLLIGVGGLGSPIALYLAAAGVGRIGLVDDDVVSESNLQRQVLYTESEVGQPKVGRLPVSMFFSIPFSMRGKVFGLVPSASTWRYPNSFVPL